MSRCMVTDGHLLFLTGLLICIASGCNDDNAPTQCPVSPLTNISGKLMGPSGPLAGQISIDWVDWPGGPLHGVWQHTYAGADGRFSLCVAPGSYRIGVDPEGGPFTYYAAAGCVWSRTAADTVVIGDQDVSLEILCGELRLDLTLLGYPHGSPLAAYAFGERTDDYPYVETEILGECATLRFIGLPAGPYVVAFQFPEEDYRYYIHYPQTRFYEDAESLDVQAGALTHISHALPEPVQITGAVLGSWQRIHPEHMPSIVIYDDEGRHLCRTYAGYDGEYAVRLLLPEAVRIRVSHNRSRYWIGGDDFASAQRFDAQAGDAIMVEPFMESGILCHLVGEGPAPGEEVGLRLYDEEGAQLESWKCTVNAAQEVGISHLMPGEYRLHIEMEDPVCQGWLAQWFNQAASLDDATPISIATAGETVEIEIDLIRGGRVAGVMRREDGGFIGSMSVGLYSAIDSTQSVAGYSLNSVTGEFCVGGLENGSYRMRALGPYGFEIWYPDARSFSHAEVLTIEDHGAITDLDWVVKP